MSCTKSFSRMSGTRKERERKRVRWWQLNFETTFLYFITERYSTCCCNCCGSGWWWWERRGPLRLFVGCQWDNQHFLIYGDPRGATRAINNPFVKYVNWRQIMDDHLHWHWTAFAVWVKWRCLPNWGSLSRPPSAVSPPMNDHHLGNFERPFGYLFIIFSAGIIIEINIYSPGICSKNGASEALKYRKGTHELHSLYAAAPSLFLFVSSCAAMSVIGLYCLPLSIDTFFHYITEYRGECSWSSSKSNRRSLLFLLLFILFIPTRLLHCTIATTNILGSEQS